MKTSFFKKSIPFVIALTILASCSEKYGKFTIQGKITDANEQVLYLEKKSLTESSIIDSVKLDKEGNYIFKQTSPEYPEFYSLKLNGQSISLSVDSIETITVNAPKGTFAFDYSVEGSNSSAKMKEVAMAQYKLSKTIADLKQKQEKKEITTEEYADLVINAISEYKSLATEVIMSNYQSMAAYYALFQKVDDLLIFDPYDKKDIRMFQSIATIWDQNMSRSPRATHLKNFTLSALSEIRKESSLSSKLGEAIESSTDGFYNISLPDMQNKNIELASLKGKIVILDFTAYATKTSPAHNISLNKVYSKYKDNVEVYQVSFDNESHAWRNTAVNLPWICVRDAKSEASSLLTKFNIQGLPTTFIIDKQGNIVKRMETKDDLDVEIRKIL